MQGGSATGQAGAQLCSDIARELFPPGAVDGPGVQHAYHAAKKRAAARPVPPGPRGTVSIAAAATVAACEGDGGLHPAHGFADDALPGTGRAVE